MTTKNENLTFYFYEQAKNTILNVDTTTIDDIYLISFHFHCLYDDMRHASIIVGYNTLTQLEKAKKYPYYSDEQEAKWHYEFSFMNELSVLGGDDPIYQSWVHHHEDYYTDEEEKANFDECLEKGGRIVDTFMDSIVEVSLQLHLDGVILKKFGREIPVIINQLAPDMEMAQLTKRANPSGLANEYINWIASMYK